MTKKQFFKKFKLFGVHTITAKQLQEIRDTLKDQDIEIPFNTLHQFYNFSGYTFTFKKQDFILNQTDHLNFKVEFDSKNPSREIKDVFESSNTIYYSPDRVPLPKNIKTILNSPVEKFEKLSKENDLSVITLIYENFFLYDII